MDGNEFLIAKREMFLDYEMIKFLKIPVCLFSIIFISILCIVQTSESVAGLNARQIMEQVNTRFKGNNCSAFMEMTLIDKFGVKNSRKVIVFINDIGSVTYKILRFTSPSNVNGVKYIIHDYESSEQEDIQWFFLPALNKETIVSSIDRNNSFMGSDFLFSDMINKNLKDYSFDIMNESTIGENEVWLINAIPESSEIMQHDGYERSVLFIRKDNFVIIRAVSWINGSQDLKYFDVKELKQINGVWVPFEIHMSTKRNKKTLHKTVLRYYDVKFNQDFPENFFSIHRFQKEIGR